MATVEDSMNDAVTVRSGDGSMLGHIDQYTLVRELGGGGFGTVYLARDTVSGVEYAVKGLPPMVRNSVEEMENVRANFALVSRLSHTNIARAYVLHLAKDVVYCDPSVRAKLRVDPDDTLMVMEYAPGVTLSKWRRQFPGGKVPLAQALMIVRQVAAAIDYAHGERILHRDIKPANVMVETKPDGGLVARVLDFGLAAEIRSSMGRVSREIHDTSGTRPYMAPEQWLGDRQGPATDQYALAVLFYELVTGTVPFASLFDTGDPVLMMTVVTTRAPKFPADLPDHVRLALARALAKNPEDRFASCGDFAIALMRRTASLVVRQAIPPSEPSAGSGNAGRRTALHVAKGNEVPRASSDSAHANIWKWVALGAIVLAIILGIAAGVMKYAGKKALLKAEKMIQMAQLECNKQTLALSESMTREDEYARSLVKLTDGKKAVEDELKKSKHDRKVEVEKKEQEIKRLTSEKAAVEEQLQKSKAEVENLKAEVTSLKEEVSAAKDETEAAKEKLNKANETIKHMVELIKGRTSAPRTTAGSAVAGGGQLTHGDKGKIAAVDNEKLFVVIKFEDAALDELIGTERNGALPQHEMLVMRRVKGVDSKESRRFVGKIRLRQWTPKTSLVIADILLDWQEAPIEVGDVIHFD